jgi:hypothetical protein
MAGNGIERERLAIRVRIEVTPYGGRYCLRRPDCQTAVTIKGNPGYRRIGGWRRHTNLTAWLFLPGLY